MHAYMVGVSFLNAYKNRYVKNRLKEENIVTKYIISKIILSMAVAKTPKAR